MKEKTALISVYDKEGIEDFAKSLVDLGWKIISSGGTAKYLTTAGIKVTDVSDITGMQAILDHRVVTLDQRIHGGLLALDTPEHLAELEKYQIPWIDLVCVDLYPLEEEIAKKESTRESVITQTDMGGVALIRSSAKGRRIVICDKKDRVKVIKWLQDGEPDKEEFLNDLVAKAEATISRYCAISAEYHSGGGYESIFGKKVLECAYGENAYQKPASLYRNHKSKKDPLSIHNWKQVTGSPMSYNNICDLDRMIQTMTHIIAGMEKNFNKVPEVAIGVKHGNACGAGVGDDGLEVIGKMLLGDLRAIFGGSVMVNFPVDGKIAEDLLHRFCNSGKRLLDLVSAPSFSSEAIRILTRRGGKCRLLANPDIKKAGVDSLDMEMRFRYVRGGFLEQPNYTFIPDINNLGAKLPKKSRASKSQDVVLAWALGATSNSNTVTIVKDGRLVGNGVGQQDRVGAAKLAISRADEAATSAHNLGAKLPKESLDPRSADLDDAVAYSDSFFPFPDAPEVLIDRGIKTIFSTSGSVNDEKIIKLCKDKGVEIIMLPDKEARGFYQH